jgi:hypothetical protein
MHDKLDALSNLLTRLSRVPGLGFLEDRATAVTRLKHTLEGHIGDLEAKKQGLEEGAEVIGGVVRPRGKQPQQQPGGQPQGSDAQQQSLAAGRLVTPAAARKTTRGQDAQAKQKADLKAKQKLAMRKIKR